MTDFLVRRFVKNYTQLENPAVREKYGMLSGGVGIFLNLLLCIGKFISGVSTGSIAVMADAFNNLSDAGSSIITVAGFRLASRKPDGRHPFGHGRMEYLAGLAVAMLILLVGVELFQTSAEKILHPELVSLSALSAGILTVSIAIKLWLYWFNRTLSRRISSSALAATAADSLSDAAATGVLLIGLLAGHFLQLPLDGWLGAAVSLFILRAGWGAAKDTLDPLLGQPPDPALVKSIEGTVLSHQEIVGLHDLVIHDYGPGRRMLSVHAEVSADSDLMHAHDLIDHIERELRRKYAVEAVIHMDPVATGDPQTDQLRALTAALVKEIDPSITIHDFRMTIGPLHNNLIFDAVVPHSCPLSEDQARREIVRALQDADPNYYPVVRIDRPYYS